MFINSLFRKLSKCGFTLIEALIASILVGSCIMPIVGTMQNAESMTQRMVDDNKLQMLARSRMNLETSRANNDQNIVDATTMYCYEYYRDPSNESTKNSVMTALEPSKFYSKNENFSVSKPSTFDKFINEFLIKAYSVEVEVKDDVILKDGDDNSDSNFNGLKQIVVTARVIARSGEAYCNSDGVLNTPVPENSKSYSLVSLITVPIVSTEYIWALDSKNNKVLGIDPVTGLVGVTYSLTYKDSNGKTQVYDSRFSKILPSPDGKKLFLLGKKDSGIMCAILSLETGEIFSSKNLQSSPINLSSYNRPNLVNAIKCAALRQDGNMCFFISDNKLYWFEVKWNSTDPISNDKNTDVLDPDIIKSFKIGNDGFLYVCFRYHICRIPMYSNTVSFTSDDIVYKTSDSDVIDYALSPNGKKAYILRYKSSDSKYYLDTVNTLTGETKEKLIDNFNTLFYSYIDIDKLGLQVTGDGKYLAIYYAGNTSDKPKILFYNLIDGSTHPYVYSNSTSSGEFQFNKLIYAPITNTLIADICNTGEINLCDYAVCKDNVLNSKTNVPITTTKISEPNAIVDYAARNPEYLWVTTKESSNYKIKAIDLASGSYEYEKEIDLGDEPQLAAMSPSGEKIVTISNGNKYKVSDTVLASVTTPLTTNNSLEETSTQILFANTEDNNTLGIVANDSTTSESFSTLNLSDSTVTKIGELDKAYWNYKKVIGLHDGSFLALARKNDPASGTSLIDWFGKNPDDTYSKWARWVTNAKNTIKTEVYKPDDAVYDSVTNTSADECDMWYGGIVIYNKASNTPGAPFSIGTKIKKIKFLSSASTQAVYPTSITPVILKNKSTEAVDINNYIIVDYGQEIFVDGPDKQYEEEINWQNGGEMGDHCYVGWINGSFDDPSCGAISYKQNLTNCSFYADISFGDAQRMPDDSTITAFPAIGKDNDVGKTELNIRTGTYQRDYKVQFMYEKETASTITSFPPENAIDIAITPDDRTLAVTTFDGTSGKINLYDFGAYNFATETQLVGMVSDFRAKNIKYFEDGSSYCYYDLGMSKVYSGYSFKSGQKLSDALNGYGLWSLSEHPANYKNPSGSDINKRFFGYYTSYSSFKNKIGENEVKKDYVGYSDGVATRVFINQKPAEADSYSKPYYKDENRTNTKVHSSLLEYDQAGQSEYVTVQLAAKNKNVALPSDWHSLNPFVRSISENYFVQVSDKTNNASIETPKKIIGGLITSSNYETSIFSNHLYLFSQISPKEKGKSMEFEYKIPNGNVKVELFFCETVEATANKRYFNVAIEDIEVLSNFNISKEAKNIYNVTSGINKVVVKTFDTKVTDGAINIKFSNGVSNDNECAAISAIRLTYLKPKKDNETKLYYFYNDDVEKMQDIYGQKANESSRYRNIWPYSFDNSYYETINNDKMKNNPPKKTPGILDTDTVFTTKISKATSVTNISNEWEIKNNYPEIPSRFFCCSYKGKNSTDELDFDLSCNTSVATVSLYFIEHYHDAEDCRTFQIEINGTTYPASSYYDIFKIAKEKHKVVKLEFEVTLTGSSGNIHIKLKPHDDVCVISAIKLTCSKGRSDPIKKAQKGGLFVFNDYNGTDAMSITDDDANNKIKLKINSGSTNPAIDSLVSNETMPFYYEPVFIHSTSNSGNLISGKDKAKEKFYIAGDSGTGPEPSVNYLSFRNSPSDNFIASLLGDKIIRNGNDSTTNKTIYLYDKDKFSDSSVTPKTIELNDDEVYSLLNIPYTNITTATPSFELIGNLEEARYGSNNAVVASGGIYLAGGQTNDDDVIENIYRFNPYDSVKLTKIASTTLYGNSLAAYDNSLYIFNGSSDKTVSTGTAYVYKYDIESKLLTISQEGKTEFVPEIVETEKITTTYDLTPTVSSTPNIFSESGSFSSTTTAFINNPVRWFSGCDYSKKNGPYYAFDNNEGNDSYWKIFYQIYWWGGEDIPYVSIDYKDTYRLKSIEVTCRSKNSYCYVEGWSSTDNKWVNICSFSLLKNEKTKYISNKKTQCTKFRISFRGVNKWGYASSGSIKINEIKIIGDKDNDISEIIPGYNAYYPDSGPIRTLDDELNPIKTIYGGSCTTPYGIMLAGGKVPNISNTELVATTTALIYWPHAMGDYDPIKKTSLYGLCRSLPDMTNAVFGNSLVWHKGKVWCISKQAPMQFDFGSNAWSTPADNDSYLLKRTYTAVVSYGDFIYMFGGTKTDTTNSYFTDLNEGVIAWNPETHQIKKIANLPDNLGKSHISAAALGSHIYLFGGKTNSSSSVGSPTIYDSIYRFTP